MPPEVRHRVDYEMLEKYEAGDSVVKYSTSILQKMIQAELTNTS